MKWVVLFFICGPEICSTYIADFRYMNKEHCQMMSKDIDSQSLFELSDDHEELVKFCMPEAELSELTDKVVEDL